MAELPPLVLHVDDHELDRALHKIQQMLDDLEQTRTLVTEVTQKVTARDAAPEPCVTPSAAVYAFMGFLMSQSPPVTFGVGCHVGKGISLAGQFCQLQQWAMPPEGFSNEIKPWNKKDESAS